MSLCGLCLAMLAAAPLPPGQARLELQPGEVGLGGNLVVNGSFEQVAEGVPVGWQWDPRTTDAALAMSDEAASGRRSIRITNGTDFAPHVYGQLRLGELLALEPGKVYTLSCKVNGDDPGAAWIGGGDGWWMRLGLPGTDGEWRTISRTFTARDGDVHFPLMINTDSPTTGFAVDDVKLEAGAAPTPFVDPTVQTRPVEITDQVPPVLSSGDQPVSLAFYLHSTAAQARVPVVADLATAAGQSLGTASLTADLPRGLCRLVLTWSPPDIGHMACRLQLLVGGQRKLLASLTAEFELYTKSAYDLADRHLATAAVALDGAIARAAAANRAVPYAVAARQVASHFRDIAAAKLKAGVLASAVADLEGLAELCQLAAQRAAAVTSGKLPEAAIPDPPMTDLKIRDGNFMAGDEPVMLVGGMGYNELHDALDGYRDYGFNIAGDDWDNGFSCLNMMKGDDQPDPDAVPQLRASWSDLQRRNLAISFNPTLHYFPEWALLKYRDITGGTEVDTLPDWSGLNRHAGKRTKVYGGFFPFAIDSPNLRELVGDYYHALFSGIADHPAFRIVWLMNEPTYQSSDPHYLELYADYLQDKFGSIDRLNAAWGTDHAAFADAAKPSSGDNGATFDWLTFHQDQVASWFEWLGAQAKRHDRREVLSNKPMAWTLLHPEQGIDWEREAELWDVPGCDAGRSPGSREYSFNWAESVMCFDFQKSVAPDKPLGDFEYHYCHEPNVSTDYVRATYWHSYLHGLRASCFWVWATGQLGPGQAGAGMTDTAWSQPKVAWGTASAALDLRRLAKYVAAFPTRPEVRIYFPRASLYRDNATVSRVLGRAYAALDGLDAGVGFVTDKQLRERRLAGVKLILVPGAKYVPADVAAALQQFVAKGGAVALIGPCLSGDEYGRPLPEPLAPGDRVWTVDEGTAKELVAPLDGLLTKAGVSRPVRCLNADGEPAWPVECRTATVDGRRVTYLVGLNKDPMSVNLTADPAITDATDLITGDKVATRGLTVAPLDVKLLLLTP